MKNKNIEAEMAALKDSVDASIIRDELFEMVNHVKMDAINSRRVRRTAISDEELGMVSGGVKVEEEKKKLLDDE